MTNEKLSTSTIRSGLTRPGRWPTCSRSGSPRHLTPRRTAIPRDEGWESVTWAQVGETVETLAAGLLALGIQPEDRVAIASSTRIEWIYADLAITCAGAATTTVYPTTGAEDVGLILADSASRIAFAEDDTQVAKLRGLRDGLPELQHVVTFDGEADGEWVLSLEDLRDLGAKHLADHPTAVDDAIDAIHPEHLATLIYTSGTTGRPKGVELPHRCWTYLGRRRRGARLPVHGGPAVPLPPALPLLRQDAGGGAAADRVPDRGGRPDGQDRGGPRGGAADVHGRSSPDLREGARQGACRPSRRRAASRAPCSAGRSGSGARRPRHGSKDAGPGAWTRAQHALADRLVLSKVRARLGGRIRFLISGSAALSPDVANWFHAAGMVILEGYGLTETSAGACIVRLEDPVFGRVGPPIMGTEVRIAPDGEILLRGPSVMRGYHGLPEETDEVLDAEGWLSTGDVGELDERGHLRITDRKKDLIKTSGGKYIAPQAIEILFKAECPLASQMIVHAEGRNYATALVTLDPDAVAQWATARGVAETDYARLTAEPRAPRLRQQVHRPGQQQAEPLGDDQGLPDPRPRSHDRGRRGHAQHEGPPQGGRGEVPRPPGLDVRLGPWSPVSRASCARCGPGRSR